MIPTKTVRLHKKVYDALTEIANDTGISVGSVITNLATFGCHECGTQYLVDKHNYHKTQRGNKQLYETCFNCRPENYTPERLAEVKGEKSPKIVVAPPKEQVSVEHVS